VPSTPSSSTSGGGYSIGKDLTKAPEGGLTREILRYENELACRRAMRPGYELLRSVQGMLHTLHNNGLAATGNV